MSTTTLSNDALSYVCTLVRDRSAIELEISKGYLIEARLGRLAKQHGFTSTGAFVSEVKAKRQPKLEAEITEAMTTNETSFYRDEHPFNAVRTTVVPEMMKTRSAKRTLNIWSAACSTGQELYSIAMLLREHFPELATWKIELLGTDLSDEVLDRARQASFSKAEINRGLPDNLREKYFQQDGLRWNLSPKLTELATFKKLNLISLWPSMPTMDIVFLRNVLIYFSPETKKTILRKVRQIMAPDAVLFLGAAETTINIDDSFERVQSGESVHYRLK